MPSHDAQGPLTGQRASQTLARGLDILELVSEGPADLGRIMSGLNLTRSTAYRLVCALVERRLLLHHARGDYRLGEKLLDLGFRAAEAVNLPDLAWPVLHDLSVSTQDAVNLAARDGAEIIYIARAPGQRRLAVRHRVGDRNRVCDTALGRAFLLDGSDAEWSRHFPSEDRVKALEAGVVFHQSDEGDQISCVAAPIRGASGVILAALSLSSIPLYMDERRVPQLSRAVKEAALMISVSLGYSRFSAGRSASGAGPAELLATPTFSAAMRAP